MPLNVYMGSDNDVTVDGLTIAETGAHANAATVTATIIDSAGATVSGSSTSLAYVTGSLGRYFGSIPSTVVMTKDANYDLQIVASQSGKDVTIRLPFQATYYTGGQCGCS
jgi:hypothetical protein